VRVLVCGGRDYSDKDRLNAVLDKLNDAGEGDQIAVIIQGGARGADRLAGEWAYSKPYVRQEQFDAEWDHYGKMAGGIRNQRMLDVGQPDLVIAFPGGRGTADMVRKARRAGVQVVEIAP
jgi:hypothetical protein